MTALSMGVGGNGHDLDGLVCISFVHMHKVVVLAHIMDNFGACHFWVYFRKKGGVKRY